MIAKTIFLVIAIVAASANFTSASAQNSPKAAVAVFYKFDGANSQTFELKNIEIRKRWFSAALYGLLLRELDSEKEYMATNPGDKPHFGDGLPFRPLDEACDVNGRSYRRSLSYGKTTIKGEIAHVDVYFKYPKQCQIPDDAYAINMSKERGKWVIDDIRYIADNSSLVEDLNRKEY